MKHSYLNIGILARGHNFHGRYKYISLVSNQKAIEVIFKITELTALKNKYFQP